MQKDATEQGHFEAVEESIGPLQAQKKELQKQTKQQEDELKRQRLKSIRVTALCMRDCSSTMPHTSVHGFRQKKLVEDIQAEVDLFIGAYLKQESLDTRRRRKMNLRPSTSRWRRCTRIQIGHACAASRHCQMVCKSASASRS
eukprot:4641300-Amphidinium_carterae.1